MSDATAFLEDLIADLVDANGGWVSLHTANPPGSEVAGGAYARQAVAYSRAGTEPTVLSNNAIIEFPVATADWGVITHIGLWDAAVAGNLIARKTVAVPKEIKIGDVARFLVGDLDVTIN
jgi:hypothetical protein